MVGEVDGCLVVGDLESPIYPVFSADDPYPATLEIGDVVSLGGSGTTVAELREIDLSIPPACAGAVDVWLAAPQE